MHPERGEVVVYACLDAERRALYVGSTDHLAKRIATHRKKTWGADIADVRWTYADWRERWMLERQAIRVLRPAHNVNCNRPDLIGPGEPQVFDVPWSTIFGLDAETAA